MIKLEKRKDFIRNHPCFSNLSKENIEGLAELCFEASFKAGDIIMREGDIVDSIYLIAKGEIEVDYKIGQAEHIPQALLHEGEAIGLNQEGFFSKTGLRTATLTAISRVILIGWPMDIFHNFLETVPEFQTNMKNVAEKMLRMNFIKQAAPFVDLPTETVEKLSNEIEEIFVHEGEILFRQNDPAENCYLICSGEIEIFIKAANGEEKPLAVLRPWRLFGESALLSTATRNASARVSQAGKLLVLKREQLQELMQHHNTSESVMALIIEHSRPTQAEDVEYFHRENEEGQPITILKDKQRGQYYQLSEEGWFVWQQLDGQKNLQDITVELYKARKIFAPDAVADTVLNLADAGFAILPEIPHPPINEPVENLTRWQKLKAKLYPYRYFQWIFYNLDPKLSASYRAFVHLFFTWPAQIFMIGVIVIGAVFFAVFLQNIDARIPPLSHFILLIIALFIAQLILTILHELAHGYATKYFKHEVHRAGIIFSWFGLAAFVDTSDMWLSQRGPRIIVSFAGPYMDLFLAGLCALLAFWIAQPAFALFFWLLALVLYYSVFKNLNPLLENDGYYIIKDALRDPQLRFHAFDWIKNSRLANIKNHKKEGIYWLICGAFFIFALLIAFAFQYYLRLFLPISILGISTAHLAWIIPGLVIVNYILILRHFFRSGG